MVGRENGGTGDAKTGVHRFGFILGPGVGFCQKAWHH